MRARQTAREGRVSLTVCLGACSIDKARASAYLWMFLNWALGLTSQGCHVLWLTTFPDGKPEGEVISDLLALRSVLAQYGLSGAIAVCPRSGTGPNFASPYALDLDAAAEADVFLNLAYHQPGVVSRFRRTAFIDIDPGLTQLWMSRGELYVPAHDVYFTYGETVGSTVHIPGSERKWSYTPPPVHLPEWPVVAAPPTAAYTTVSSWWGEWISIGGAVVENSKRASILSHIDLPARSQAMLELALPLTHGEVDAADQRLLEASGWRVRSAAEVCRTPETVRAYIQSSRGEYSCMKAGYSLLETAWTSERTINYLASGKPAIVQHTGRSRFLPDDEGLLRFRDTKEAAQRLASVEADYTRHCRAARQLAEEYFAADRVVAQVLSLVA
jgi:hypothetical protein